MEQERTILQVVELLNEVVEKTGITRAELAKRLGKSRSWVSQVLAGDGNPTLATISDVLFELGRKLFVLDVDLHSGMPKLMRFEPLDDVCPPGKLKPFPRRDLVIAPQAEMDVHYAHGDTPASKHGSNRGLVGANLKLAG